MDISNRICRISEENTHRRARPLRTLLVDAGTGSRRRLAEMLVTGNPSQPVVPLHAGSAQEALDLLKNSSPDICLLGRVENIPLLLEALRSDDHGIPVIIIGDSSAPPADLPGLCLWLDRDAVSPCQLGTTANLLLRLHAERQDHRRLRELAHLSEQRLQSMADTIPVIVWTMDTAGMVTSFSGNVLEPEGFTPESVIGRNFHEIFPDRKDVHKRIKRVLQGERIKITVSLFNHFFLLSYSPLMSTRGTISGVIGVALDITGQAITEQALDRAHQALASHLENSPLAVIEWDGDFRITRWSLRAEELFGWSERDITSRSPGDWPFADSGESSRLREVLQQLLDRKVPRNIHRSGHRTQSGEALHCQWYNSALFNRRGQLVSILSLVQDVTMEQTAKASLENANDELERRVQERTAELKHTLEFAENARDRIDAILKSVGDGLMVTDTENRIVLMNRGAEEILSVSFPEVLGSTVELAVQDFSFREELIENIARARQSVSYQFDFEIDQQPLDIPRFIRARTSVVSDRNNVQTGVVTLLMDVTREREVDRMKSEFISTAAHELRTPLTSIQGFSELLITRESFSPEDVKEYMIMINRSAMTLSQIVSDLLDISRIEAGNGFTIHRTVCDPRPFIRKKVKEFRRRHSTLHRFYMTLAKCPDNVPLDADRFEQVLENLLSNAVKYSPGGGRVQVVARRSAETLLVRVADEGIGMNQEQTARIFEKFYRGHASDGGVQGTGLGMSIVKYIVEGHGGCVWVNSEQGAGTTVSFSIPLFTDRQCVPPRCQIMENRLPPPDPISS